MERYMDINNDSGVEFYEIGPTISGSGSVTENAAISIPTAKPAETMWKP